MPCLLCEKGKTSFTFAVRRLDAPLAPPAKLIYAHPHQRLPQKKLRPSVFSLGLYRRALCPLGPLMCPLGLPQNQQCALWVSYKTDNFPFVFATKLQLRGESLECLARPIREARSIKTIPPTRVAKRSMVQNLERKRVSSGLLPTSVSSLWEAWSTTVHVQRAFGELRNKQSTS